jgi:hypothetical protein
LPELDLVISKELSPLAVISETEYIDITNMRNIEEIGDKLIDQLVIIDDNLGNR